MAFEVRVERGRCIGTKACINAAPDTFALDQTLRAVVVDPEASTEADLVAAAESCPTGAISLWRDGVKLS